MVIEEDACMYCGCCASVCPSTALVVTDYEVMVTDECTDCKICAKACPMGAIR